MRSNIIEMLGIDPVPEILTIKNGITTSKRADFQLRDLLHQYILYDKKFCQISHVQESTTIKGKGLTDIVTIFISPKESIQLYLCEYVKVKIYKKARFGALKRLLAHKFGDIVNAPIF